MRHLFANEEGRGQKFLELHVNVSTQTRKHKQSSAQSLLWYVQSFSGIYFDLLQFWHSTWLVLWSWHLQEVKFLVLLITKFIVVECYSSWQCISIVFYCYCILSVLYVYCLWRMNFIINFIINLHSDFCVHLTMYYVKCYTSFRSLNFIGEFILQRWLMTIHYRYLFEFAHAYIWCSLLDVDCCFSPVFLSLGIVCRHVTMKQNCYLLTGAVNK